MNVFILKSCQYGFFYGEYLTSQESIKVFDTYDKASEARALEMLEMEKSDLYDPEGFNWRGEFVSYNDGDNNRWSWDIIETEVL